MSRKKWSSILGIGGRSKMGLEPPVGNENMMAYTYVYAMTCGNGREAEDATEGQNLYE